MKGQKYALCFEAKKNYNAGSKATTDIDNILRLRGYHFIFLPLFITKYKLWSKILNLVKYSKLILIKRKAIVFVQHPQYIRGIYMDFLKALKRIKHCKFIFLVHDLESLRQAFPENNKYYQELDKKMLMISDIIIAHNQAMIHYLNEKCYVPKCKLINLGLFDYLISDDAPNSSYEKGVIVVAGNLMKKKSGYLYELPNVLEKVHLRVYGANFEVTSDTENAAHIIYEGTYSPEELPGKLKGAWGLVWDGPSIDTCEGNMGNYMRYNNPHKLSLYISAGLPVIIWEKSALAPFVKENYLGIVVGSLRNIERIIVQIDDLKYEQMKHNINKFSNMVKNGVFANNAIEKAERILVDKYLAF